MKIPEIYDYLIATRRQMWAALEKVPAEVLSRPLAGDEWFPCLKDLIFHIITVEDGWLNLDILRQEPVLEHFPTLRDAEEGAACDVKLEVLLEYWRAVEKRTLEYLAELTDEELQRITAPHDEEPQEHLFKVDGLLWHMMIHEMRHTAQIVVLLRAQGIKPPALDLLWYLPNQQH
ncbi:MAG: DinB family protein [Trueperaceae bacterium]|nr:DinB family protein [Trueperaceae bacterium]